jgi:8-oxo-dGTP pyrophosphatase MutT (NUDIX family)
VTGVALVEGSYVWRLRQALGTDTLLLPGATVLVLDADERVLLMRRRDTGRWGLPGGGAEPGSSFASTALRELEEETGLGAVAADLEAFACVSEPDLAVKTYPHGDRVHAFDMCFAVRRWTGDLRPVDGEAVALEFFADLPEQRNEYVDVVVGTWRAYEETGRFQVG